jgi:hypothetical protein
MELRETKPILAKRECHRHGPSKRLEVKWSPKAVSPIARGQHVKPKDGTRWSFSRFEAWVDLVAAAYTNQANVNNLGVVHSVQPGDVVVSRRWLAERWNWSIKTVRYWLRQLEQHELISIQEQEGPHRVCTLLTIIGFADKPLHYWMFHGLAKTGAEAPA